MKSVGFVSVLRVVLHHCHMDMRRMSCSANPDSFNNVLFWSSYFKHPHRIKEFNGVKRLSQKEKTLLFRHGVLSVSQQKVVLAVPEPVSLLQLLLRWGCVRSVRVHVTQLAPTAPCPCR